MFGNRKTKKEKKLCVKHHQFYRECSIAGGRKREEEKTHINVTFGRITFIIYMKIYAVLLLCVSVGYVLYAKYTMIEGIMLVLTHAPISQCAIKRFEREFTQRSSNRTSFMNIWTIYFGLNLVYF